MFCLACDDDLFGLAPRRLEVSVVLGMLTLPSLLAMLLLLPFLATSDAPRRLARGALLGGLFRAAGLVLIRRDPARVWVWIFD